MKIDTDRIDDAVLALMHISLHDYNRSWKGFDFDTLDRLHAKGLISKTPGRTKSVCLSEAGLRRSEELFLEMFTDNGGKD